MATLSYARGRWMNLEKAGGAVFFVGGGTPALNGVNRSDTYKGLTPEEPFSTVQKGLDQCVAGRGDTVVLLPGSVTITAALTMTKDDVTLTGASVTGPNTRNPSVIACATNSVEMVAIDAANVIVENLTLDHNATTADVFLIDIADSTASPDCVLRNLFLDMVGSATTTNGIRVGDGTQVAINSRIEGCTLHDLDDIGITITDANTNCVIDNCDIYDNPVSGNTMLTGISAAADYTRITNCRIKNSAAAAGASCVNLTATAQSCFLSGNRLSAFGAGGHGVLYAASASGVCLDVHVTANALADSVDFTTAVTGLSGVTGQVSAPADGTVSELPNPNVA
jgi:hypothetical protein